MAHEGQFEVVNNSCSVHRHGRDNASFHQVRDDRGKPHLDDMGADPEDDRAAPSMRLHDGLGDGPQCCDCEDVWEAGREGRERPPAFPRRGQVPKAEPCCVAFLSG